MGLRGGGLGADDGGTGATLGGAILIAAGLYQMTPIKQACLRHCRSPIVFLTQHWRRAGAAPGAWGWCTGPIVWAAAGFLMALLFVGGIMNVLWIAGLALYVCLKRWCRPAIGWPMLQAGR
jgi:predicted metal-binding membrane protein